MRWRRGGAVLGLSAALLYMNDVAVASPTRIVAPNTVFIVTASGFRGGAEVREQLFGTMTHGTVVADRHGRVRVRYRAPNRVGHYRLLFSGPPRIDDGRPSPTDADIAVLVRVPRLVVVDFTVARSGPSNGVAGGSASRPPTSSRGAGVGGQAAGPADTGTDVAALLAVGAALLGVGTAVLEAARRRRPAVRHSP